MNPIFGNSNNQQNAMEAIGEMLTQKFGNISNMMSAISEFSKGFQGDPVQYGNDLIKNKLTKEQAEQAANLTNAFSKFNPNNIMRSFFGQK